MSMESLDRAYRANPFRPFTFRLSDGRTIPVPRRESLAFNPKGRTAVVIDEGDGFDFVDVPLVESLAFDGDAAGSGLGS